MRRRDGIALALLLALPALAHLPALWEQRLLAPGEGAVLHFPLRVAAWRAWSYGQIPSWNPSVFLGAPLLASYRAGALHPLMLLLAPLPAFSAFQVLVIVSLGCAGASLYLLARRLGAESVGAYVGALAFSLGPYLVGHLGDTATLVAAPGLPLALLAAETCLERAGRRGPAGLACSVTLVALAGSPRATRALLLLLLGRALLAALRSRSQARDGLWRLAAGAGLGVLLAAPQLLPSLIAWHEAAGVGAAGRSGGVASWPGLTGLVLRYAAHTPTPALAIAAIALARRSRRVRVLLAACAAALALRWGRGPLAAPGTLALIFDLLLCLLASLSLSAQWRLRRDPRGRRLRGYFLAACLGSAAALSLGAAALGPLPESLAGAVGILALALILYFSNAAAPDTVRAGVWLLPLTVSFVLQPHGRRVWDDAPTRAELYRGSGTREALERAMGARRDEPALALVGAWPAPAVANDLAYANLAALSARVNANGYDPLVPRETLRTLGGMSTDGTLPDVFFRSDPARLEALGVRWAEVPVSLLRGAAAEAPCFRLEVAAGRPRFFAFPITLTQEVRLISSLSGGAELSQEQLVAWLHVRLASGRDFALPVRAGVETAEAAYDGSERRPEHARAPVVSSFALPDGAGLGHDYLGRWTLPGRYFVDGLRLERVPGPGRLDACSVVLVSRTGRQLAATPASAYLSDSGHFREAAATPVVRLFELPAARPRAWVASEPAAREGPAAPAHGWRASVVHVRGAQLEVRAQGPGLLGVATSWDPGWRARVDGRPARCLRVNDGQLGVALGAGVHRVELEHDARGFVAGLGLALAAVLTLTASWLRSGGERDGLS